MINTLFLPEIREMLAENNAAELSEFCIALHPSRTAEFMAGLSAEEIWRVFAHTDIANQVEILSYFDRNQQVDVIEHSDHSTASALIAELPPDDRVDLLQELPTELQLELTALMPADVRRDYLRLSQFPDGTAGAVMTSDVTKLREGLTIREALDVIGQQAEDRETIYYLYIVDEEDHLRGLVSARQLLGKMRKPDTRLSEIMETELVTARVMDDQEEVANKVARMDLLAIPVVDQEYRMVGIITHDDVIDVVREEATEDAHRIAAVEPLDESYLLTSLLTLSWKRGIWLTILFFCALLTAFALEMYEERLKVLYWLVPFIPLIISSGGNSGSQSATLIITALSRNHIHLSDWMRVISRELVMGLLLGLGLGLLGYLASVFMIPNDETDVRESMISIEINGGDGPYDFKWTDGDRTVEIDDMRAGDFAATVTDGQGTESPARVEISKRASIGRFAVFVVPLTLLFVVMSGTLTGSILPLIFERLGLDPAMMSNPFVAGIVDILGIVIYMTVATWLVSFG